jgi:hypothetical protein
MSSDKFIDAAIKDGEKIISLLDSDDQKRISLFIDAVVQKEYGKYEQSSDFHFLGLFVFAALTLTSGIFYATRPDGWPWCSLEHREKVLWYEWCLNKEGEGSFCSRRYRDEATKIIYRSNINGWICEADSLDAQSFACKNQGTLIKEF